MPANPTVPATAVNARGACKLYVVMVGLPARGKSTVAAKIKANLEKEGLRVQLFNNGDLRRRMAKGDTAHAGFYAPDNAEGVALREKFARINMQKARNFLSGQGQIAILDATNVSQRRRMALLQYLNDHPILFIECVNEAPELLAASVARKIETPEFSHLPREEAVKSFEERIAYYRRIYSPFDDEPNHLTVNTLDNHILNEKISERLPFYDRLRDLLVSDWVRNLFLARHGESVFNLEDRIGGDAELTERGRLQAEALAEHFRWTRIPYVFTSTRRRTRQMAEPLARAQEGCKIVALSELDEIDSGEFDSLTYEEIRSRTPEEFAARARDKYNYAYPGGESYAALKERVDRGVKKALYLSGNAGNIVIIGHRAVNRMILSHFLYRRQEDVPYLFIPQDRYFHIVSTQTKKLFQLVNF